MIYPIFIFKTSEGFDGYFPDVEGCFFAGEKMSDIPKNAEEAFGVHMEALIEEGFPVPAPPPKIRNPISMIVGCEKTAAFWDLLR